MHYVRLKAVFFAFLESLPPPKEEKKDFSSISSFIRADLFAAAREIMQSSCTVSCPRPLYCQNCDAQQLWRLLVKKILPDSRVSAAVVRVADAFSVFVLSPKTDTGRDLRDQCLFWGKAQARPVKWKGPDYWLSVTYAERSVAARCGFSSCKESFTSHPMFTDA